MGYEELGLVWRRQVLKAAFEGSVLSSSFLSLALLSGYHEVKNFSPLFFHQTLCHGVSALPQAIAMTSVLKGLRPLKL